MIERRLSVLIVSVNITDFCFRYKYFQYISKNIQIPIKSKITISFCKKD